MENLRAAIDAQRASLRGSSFAANPEGFKQLESLKVRLNTAADPLFYTHQHEALAEKQRAKRGTRKAT